MNRQTFSVEEIEDMGAIRIMAGKENDQFAGLIIMNVNKPMDAMRVLAEWFETTDETHRNTDDLIKWLKEKDKKVIFIKKFTTISTSNIAKFIFAKEHGFVPKQVKTP